QIHISTVTVNYETTRNIVGNFKSFVFAAFNKFNIETCFAQVLCGFVAYFASAKNHYIFYFLFTFPGKSKNLVITFTNSCEINLITFFKLGITTWNNGILGSKALQGNGNKV